MLSKSEYLKLDAVALAAGIRRKDFSCAEVTSCAIEQAKAANPAINAINIENYEAAQEEAELVDSKPELLDRSPVAGLPFLIKDLSDVQGLASSYGSRLWDGYVADSNSKIVQKYLDAGLIVFGKTNTPEKGLVITTEPVANGITRNPWNLEHSTGGSSGGAAAAVAAGISPVAHATDGGGSIRIPASCCGLFGLKPSRGLTAVENGLAYSWSGMSVGHVVSQTVRDSAAFLDVIKLSQPNLFPLPDSPNSFFDNMLGDPDSLKIGLQLDHPIDQEIDPECIAAVNQAAKLCDSLGHSVEEIVHPVNYRPVITAMSTIINLHVYQTLAPRLEQLNISLEDAPIEASTKVMASNGRNTKAEGYVDACDLISAAARKTAKFHNDFDVIISPVLSKPPAKIGWLNMNSDNMKEYTNRFKQYSGFTALYNGTGQPSMSVPLHRTADNLPVGVMITGSWGSDALLLQLARQLEQAQPWKKHVESEA